MNTQFCLGYFVNNTADVVLMAEKIFLSSFTVDSHRKNLLAKLNVKNTACLIKLAVEKILI
ncbi:MAG: LuxR C-terminal-related transcriptional regulator [Chitinophagaceae bacterium]